VGPATSPIATLKEEVGATVAPLQGEVATQQANSTTSLLPSTTATDITQIVSSQTNLDQTSSGPKPMNMYDQEQSELGENLIPGVRTFASRFESEEVERLMKEGIKFAANTGNNYFNLDKGNVVFSPDKDIVVGTHEGNVYIAAGTSVFVMETGHDVAVYDLFQSRPGQVSIVSGQKKLSLEPGRVVVLTRQDTDDFDEIQGSCRRIGYRRPTMTDVDKSIKAFAAEFSIPSALNIVVPLKRMLTSDERRDQTAIAKILKSSVLLEDLNGVAGPFTNGDMDR
jgi:hypothetical protein